MPPIISTKTEASPIDGTPEKRIFWSLIADYGLRTGLCELLDNAIDLWASTGKKQPLKIMVFLDQQRQIVVVRDNAGGIKASDLRLLIAPGGSRNDPKAQVIGVFGVGSKRASVAIGERVEIKTRHLNGSSFQVDVTKEWLESPDWLLPSYEIPEIDPRTTEVSISHLRRPFVGADIEQIKLHFSEVYASFIGSDCSILVNGYPLTPKKFDSFAFPPNFLPQSIDLAVNVKDIGIVQIEISAGLILDREPEAENYGVYFYCNDRLIEKEMRTREVGYFVSSEAGVPHPDASMARVIARLTGPARAMPWNSSKSAVDTDHPVFHAIRPNIIELNSFFTKLSRRFKSDWGGSVLKFSEGAVEKATTQQTHPGVRVILPQLPKVNKSHVERLKEINKVVISKHPWTLGLVEAICAVQIVQRQKYDTRNRIALILLDSNFEIALKEFIVHRADLFPPSVYNDAKIATLFKNRQNVISEVCANFPAFPQAEVAKANHFYLMRNKIIHERASVGVTDNDVESYRLTVETILKLLFSLKFS